MRKIICLVGALSILLLLIGCSSENNPKNQGVPDQYLKLDVDDYYYAEELEGSYTFTSVHNYDTSTNTDSVEITLRINHKYADEVVTGKCTYQYDKTSGNWSRIGTVRWGEMELDYKPKAYKTTIQCKWFTQSWEVTIKELNLNNNTITCQIVLNDSDGPDYTSDGFHTYSLSKGHWYGFSFTANGQKYHATLYEDTGLLIYTD